MTVPLTTSETLKHKINPSVDLAEPQTVHVLLYTPGTAGWTIAHCYHGSAALLLRVLSFM